MHQWLAPYSLTVYAMLATAFLFLVQLLVLDVAGIVAKHIPGTPVQADHSRFLFRVTRTHANTNESVAVFILLAVVAIFTAATPAWVNACAWLYVVARLGHMLCYYADLRAARSVAFALSLMALLSLLVVVSLALL